MCSNRSDAALRISSGVWHRIDLSTSVSVATTSLSRSVPGKGGGMAPASAWSNAGRALSCSVNKSVTDLAKVKEEDCVAAAILFTATLSKEGKKRRRIDRTKRLRSALRALDKIHDPL